MVQKRLAKTLSENPFFIKGFQLPGPTLYDLVGYPEDGTTARDLIHSANQFDQEDRRVK